MDSSMNNISCAESVARPAEAAPMPYAHYRILVADDQESITALIERVVGLRLGCQVTCARDGLEVLKIIEQGPVDVLVTDMMMPGLHGFDLLEKVHAACPAMDIIVMTGYPEDFPYVEVVHAGAQDFINKPFPHAELEAKLLRLFKERELERERIMAESKYRSLFELSADGMVLLEDDTFTIADANRAFSELVGVLSSSLKGKPIADLFTGSDRLRLEQGLIICSHRGGGTMADLLIAHPSGRQIHVDISASFIRTEFGRNVFLTFKDVTEKREVERQLAEAAEKDALTGLFNKRSFQNRIAWATARARDNNTPVTLLMIDLDNFKKCNDTYGHQVGDELLVSVGHVIRRSIRTSMTDEGFRCGGDEFAVILQETNAEGALQVAQRMQSEFERIENRYGTTMSIGVACGTGTITSEELIRKSDDALYRAKGAGKNAIEVAKD